MSIDAYRVHRLDAASAQRWTVRVCIVVALASAVSVLLTVAWTLGRLEAYTQAAASHGVMAVIDKCGQSYQFATVSPNEWQPDEALYFDKLGSVVECTRGLQIPARDANGMVLGRSCWPGVWRLLSETANKQLNGELARLGKSRDEQLAAMSKRRIAIQVLPGSTKSADGRYRLQWHEVERSVKGDVVRDEYWSGTFELSRVVADEKAIADGNAIGLRIESFQWSKDTKVGG